MAPSNTYLQDKAVQDHLAAHDPLLIKYTATWSPGQDPEQHCDFNRDREFELLGDHLRQFTDADFRSGNVLIADALQAAYGTSNDEYLAARLTSTHLHPASTFNKKVMSNGQVMTADPSGTHIIRGDRRQLALEIAQMAADLAATKAARSLTRIGKSLTYQNRKALRVDPTAKKEIGEIGYRTAENIQEQTRLALNPGAGQ